MDNITTMIKNRVACGPTSIVSLAAFRQQEYGPLNRDYWK
jgi:hypothetical protein